VLLGGTKVEIGAALALAPVGTMTVTPESSGIACVCGWFCTGARYVLLRFEDTRSPLDTREPESTTGMLLRV
jgi:hypothetical protein